MSIIDVICDYSNKDLSEVPAKVLDMYNLKMLYLEGNCIEVLPDNIFEKLSKLTWLDLRKNKLTTIPSGIAHHTFLETLLLQDNNIEELPNEIGVVPNLKVLQLSGNPLKYPLPEIVDEGIQSVCSFLKQEYYKTNNPATEEEDEQEMAVVESKSSTVVTRSTDKITVQELLQHSIAKNRKGYGPFMPIIDVKGLSRTNSEEDNTVQKQNNSWYVIRPNSGKKMHKITRNCSKISLRSHSQWNSKKKLSDIEQAQKNELKEIWLKRLREVLADQEKILQQEKNLNALSKWRLDKKMEPPRTSLDEVPEAPFATDPDCNRILSRKDLTNQIDKMIKKSKKTYKRMPTSKKADIQKLIKEVVDQMKNLETNLSSSKSPRTEQEIAAKQIESIVELHKKIVAIQASNHKSL